MVIISGFLLFLFIYSGVTSSPDTVKNVYKGIFSLEGYDLESPIPLVGEWEYFDTELIIPSSPSDSYAVLPQTWENKNFSWATYKMTITGLDPSVEYALKVPYQLTAYSLFVNGDQFASNGIVSENPLTGQPESQPIIKAFRVSGHTAELVFQISNHVSRRGGPFQALLFGTRASIQKYDFWCIFIDGVFSALFLISSLYQFSFFVLKKSKDNLFLGFLFLCISSFFLIETPDVIIMALIPKMSWYLLEKIASLLLYQLPLWAILYVHSLFRVLSFKRVTLILLPLMFIYAFVFLLSPATFSALNPYFHLYSGYLYLVIGYMIIKKVKDRDKRAIILLGVYSIFLGAVVSQSLLSLSPFPFGNYFPLTFIKLALGQHWNGISFGIIDAVSFLLIFGVIIISIVPFPNLNTAEITKHSAPDILLYDSLSRSRIDEFDFSAREKEVLVLLLKGKSNKEIAAELFISLSTVKTHISRIFKKTNASSRAEVFSYLLNTSS